MSSSVTTSTESAGLIISLRNNRPSDYANGRLHDVVGLDIQQSIEAGTMTGRAHGLEVGVGPAAGADGYVAAVEATVINNSGNTSGTLGTPTSKVALHAVAFGNAPSTAALVTSTGDLTLMPNAKFIDGLVVVQESLVSGGRALSVRPISFPWLLTTRADDLAGINRDGSAFFTGLTVPQIAAPGGGNLPFNSPVVLANGGYTGTAPVGTSDATIANTAFVQAATSILSKAGAVTTADIPAGQTRVVKNTTSGNMALCANDGGTLRCGPTFTTTVP